MTNTVLEGKSFWGRIATGYSKTGGAKWIRHPWAIKLAGNPRNKKILESGCGTGVIINSLVKCGAIGLGVDYSKEMIRKAKKNAMNEQINTIFLVLDAKDLRKIYEQKFDLIIFSAVLATLTSVSEIIKVLKEAKKVLKDDGAVLVAEPHPAFDPYMRSFLQNLRKGELNYFPSSRKYLFPMKDFNNKQIYSYAYHWSLEDYSEAIYCSGYCIERIFEPKPLKVAYKENEEWYKERSRYPSYIFLRLKKVS